MGWVSLAGWKPESLRQRWVGLGDSVNLNPCDLRRARGCRAQPPASAAVEGWGCPVLLTPVYKAGCACGALAQPDGAEASPGCGGGGAAGCFVRLVLLPPLPGRCSTASWPEARGENLIVAIHGKIAGDALKVPVCLQRPDVDEACKILYSGAGDIPCCCTKQVLHQLCDVRPPPSPPGRLLIAAAGPPRRVVCFVLEWGFQWQCEWLCHVCFACALLLCHLLAGGVCLKT